MPSHDSPPQAPVSASCVSGAARPASSTTAVSRRRFRRWACSGTEATGRSTAIGGGSGGAGTCAPAGPAATTAVVAANLRWAPAPGKPDMLGAGAPGRPPRRQRCRTRNQARTSSGRITTTVITMGHMPRSLRVADDRARHAMAAAAAAAELEPGDRVHLDSGLAELEVGRLVALVGDDDPGRQGDDVVAVVPLVALGLELVAAGRHDGEVRQAQLPPDLVEERALGDLGAHAAVAVGRVADRDDVRDHRLEDRHELA